MNESTSTPTTSHSSRGTNEIGELIVHELQHLRTTWYLLFLLGIVLILCGLLAVTFPMFSTLGVVMALGIVLLFAGLATIITSFITGKWSAFLVQLLMGIFYTVIGLMMAESPLNSAAALTLLVASFAIVGGAFRVIAALNYRFSQWGWMLLSGLVSVLFGVVVIRHFPEASLWLIGLMLGLDLIFSGIHWLMLSLTIRSLPAEHDRLL
ncbi:HdeD family acid-resistance protein [Novipirellula galeiformis]|nr:HdeD family acid-resistance protein [Novipirellula galeiformis]